MRGRERTRVITVLAATTASAGALAGFVLGVVNIPAARLLAATGPSDTQTLAVPLTLLALAVLGDLSGARPPSVRRQVPRQWGRIFPPAGAAALYGARLGVGPLTPGVSWLWWAMALSAAMMGPWPSLAAGAVFGSVRALTTVAAGLRMAPRGA